MSDFEFNVVKEIKVLSVNEKNAWQKELNLISWNGKPAKYDIRDWSPDHSKMGKGITLTKEELSSLLELSADSLE